MKPYSKIRQMGGILTLATLTPIAFGFAGALNACGKDDSFFDPTADNDADDPFGDSGGFNNFNDSASDDLDAFAGCATASAEADRTPAYMLFVLDGSRSMNQSNKWTAAKGALGAMFDDLHTRKDKSIGAGFTIFCDSKDTTCLDVTAGPYPTAADVPIAYVDDAQHTALQARLNTTLKPQGDPGGGTPTYEVLHDEYASLQNFTPGAPLMADGKKVLVFITDGIPDDTMPDGNDEAPGSIRIAAAQFAKAIPDKVTTFAVGVGNLPADLSVYDPTFVGKLAVAGGAPNPGCDPMEKTDPTKMCHFQITPGAKTPAVLQQEFFDAINAISNKVLSCEYQLRIDAEAGTVNFQKVNVVYTDGAGDKQIVPSSATDGWTYDDPANPTKVILTGATCDRVKADPEGRVDIVLGCLTVVR